MENLFWTADQIKTEFEGSNSLGEVIHRIENRVSKSGQVVCRVLVNGMSLSEGDEGKFKESSMSEIRELGVEIGRVDELLEATRQSTVQYAKALQATAEDVANQLRSEKLYEAHIGFRKLVEGIDSLVAASHLMKDVLSDDSLITEDWRNFEKEFLVLLSSILESYGRSDFILTADQLEYDLAGTLQKLVTILEGISQIGEGHR